MIAWVLAAEASAEDVSRAIRDAWVGTRWHVEIEETTPSPLELAAVADASFQTRALQISGVFSCGTVIPHGKKSAEILCDVDDVAMRATPRSLDQTAELTAANDAVLADLVARLRDGVVHVRVTTDGQVQSVGLEGVPETNRRESEQHEVLRRLMYDVFAAFHLRRDDGWQKGWTERNSALLRAPTQPAGIASTVMAHVVSTIDGSVVVQSTGQGTFTSPYEPWEPSMATPVEYQRRAEAAKPSTLGPDDFLGPPKTGTGAPPPTDRTFEGSITSVAVVDPHSGWPIERVWAMNAAPTASSVGNMQGTSIWYAGRIVKIGPDEVIPLGVTQVVAPPGHHVAGLPDWDPLETF
jgi:hypothetical protein